MGDFVRNTLPQLENHSPQAITNTVEKVMETEIDSINALVVDTNGVATSVGVEGIRAGLEVETESESDDTYHAPQRPARPRRARSNSQYSNPPSKWQSVTSQPPSPSVRRNASHADIGRLVDNWNSGPANKTFMFLQPNTACL